VKAGAIAASRPFAGGLAALRAHNATLAK